MAMVKLNKDEEESVVRYEQAQDLYQGYTRLAKIWLQELTTPEASFAEFISLVRAVCGARRCARMIKKIVQIDEIAASYNDHLIDRMMNA